MIKSRFSIKDLENLSGIKSHTIRIWEKRYGLFSPERTETNIRTYDLTALQKILNVSFLKEEGYKISAISEMGDDLINKKVSEIAQQGNENELGIQQLKIAMVNFDQALFQQVYRAAESRYGFSGAFYNVIFPFLAELGHLWHSKSINLAHEHFVSHLIKQKILVNLEKYQYKKEDVTDQVFILFLPENEMHELGLLFLNYELLRKGYNTVYLGASMLLDSLPFFKKGKTIPTYITYITVQPTAKELPRFLNEFNRKVAQKEENELWVLGPMTANVTDDMLTPNFKIFASIDKAVEALPDFSTYDK